jgi:hypothetical protein
LREYSAAKPDESDLSRSLYALVVAQHVLGAVQLILAETVAARALVFLHQRVDGRLHAALAQQGIRAERAVAAHQLAHAAAALMNGGLACCVNSCMRALSIWLYRFSIIFGGSRQW